MVARLGVPTDVGKAACSEPAALPLVDAAFARASGAEAKRLKREFCSRCEIREACLAAGMLGEFGIWGGVGRNLRTAHGSPPPKSNYHTTKRAS